MPMVVLWFKFEPQIEPIDIARVLLALKLT